MNIVFQSIAQPFLNLGRGIQAAMAFAMAGGSLEENLHDMDVFQARAQRLADRIQSEDSDAAFYFVLNIMRDKNNQPRDVNSWKDFLAFAQDSITRTKDYFETDLKNTESIVQIDMQLRSLVAAYLPGAKPSVVKLIELTVRSPDLVTNLKDHFPRRYDGARAQWLEYLSGTKKEMPKLSF